MTALRHHLSTTPTALDDPAARLANSAAADGALQMRAHRRHQGTVLTICGGVDATNAKHVSAYAARCAQVGSSLILDLGAMNSSAAHAMLLLYAVDEACGRAAAPWVVVPSPAVTQEVRVAACDGVFLTASSVPEAMRHLAWIHRLTWCFAGVGMRKVPSELG